MELSCPSGLFFSNLETLVLDKEVYIFGTGGLALVLYRALKEQRPDVLVLGFIDSYRGGEFEQLPVLKLDAFRQTKELQTRILVASVYWNEIVSALNQVGLKNYSVFVQHPDTGAYHITPDVYERDWAKFQAMADLLYSESDRSLWDLLLKLRCLPPQTPDYDSLIRYSLRNSFSISRHYLDFITPSCIGTVIEGGVEQGINLKAFLRAFGPDSVIFGFDPGLTEEFEGLLREQLGESSSRVHLSKLGLWKETATVRFKFAGAASRIVVEEEEESNKSISVTSIDALYAEGSIPAVDFIKFDIEGAEYPALKGAAKVLTQFRPQLAISIYHSVEDLYTIGLFLKGLLPGYVFRLGHYSDVLTETVLYAIPEEKLNLASN